MKAYCRMVLIAGALLVAVSLFGCHSTAVPETIQTEPTEDPIVAAYKADPVGFVVFSRSMEPSEIYVPVQEIMEYRTQYPDCNGTWFRDRLTGEDLCIYNAYLYAMEHQYIHIEMYVEDNTKDFGYIRDAVALDSPLMEQNTNQYGEFVFNQPINHLGKRISLILEQFTESRWAKKMEALDLCRKIVEQIPENCVTQEEKMLYLYRYVCDNVEYVDYEKQADEDYLYDAVCKGETVCDGYSNMLNLLFNLIGVECSEVIGEDYEDISQATEEQLKSGHTWVAAVLNGEYYNFDPTHEDTKTEELPEEVIFFGFSDDLAAKQYLSWEELRPKCSNTERDFFYADIIVDNCTSKEQISQIAKLVERQAKAGQQLSLVAVRQAVTESDYDKMIKRFGYYTDDIASLETSVIENRNSTLLMIKAQLR